jgi:hypothetical protein
LLDELRRINAPRDSSYDQGSQEAMLTALEGGDRVEVTYDAVRKTPARSVIHTVAFDYDPATRSVEFEPDREGGRRPLIADRGPDQGVMYTPKPGGEEYPVLKLKLVKSELRFDPHVNR